jgi:hypothetical protein
LDAVLTLSPSRVSTATIVSIPRTTSLPGSTRVAASNSK